MSRPLLSSRRRLQQRLPSNRRKARKESKDMAVLKAAARRASATVVVKGKPKFPIPDKAHARAALARIDQARPPLTPSQKAKVDRKSTRLNSSHSQISYAVFCLKKKKKQQRRQHTHRTTQYNTQR